MLRINDYDVYEDCHNNYNDCISHSEQSCEWINEKVTQPYLPSQNFCYGNPDCEFLRSKECEENNQCFFVKSRKEEINKFMRKKNST